ncbi:hypothetical protein [Stenotrophomonas phage BUCT627]|uniref:Uncharacterized protein n=3 Tax=Bixiavirus TaxID=3044676 RepID=A0A7D2HHT9_9CAUD|nr:hypothetical protein PQD75_gp061 [Stenotrophomonas phage vB_SmaS_BUCT548]YP_010677340.1 hypothetical protein PQD76_gp32 [Stenotrophomonas phage BUCT626]YP_010677421.1 hypothetical protein PQD77_gp015 [Stenotrophomonas phage BUCT627]QIQ60811.1 hypothetical protein [Stenotrophomonas phage vB_SmaS_BUCT548]QYC96621.1 hypothetical protein [Stenotrophomonas phage BUCT627]QYC96736.1 hypothetical protein [Stenotrophomonas phage BUCT626]
MSIKYSYEHTDTFAGEANYSWVKRGSVHMPELTHYGYDGGVSTYARADRISQREVVKAVKAKLGLTGIRCKTERQGDGYVIRPYGLCQIVFIECEG